MILVILKGFLRRVVWGKRVILDKEGFFIIC